MLGVPILWRERLIGFFGVGADPAAALRRARRRIAGAARAPRRDRDRERAPVPARGAAHRAPGADRTRRPHHRRRARPGRRCSTTRGRRHSTSCSATRTSPSRSPTRATPARWLGARHSAATTSSSCRARTASTSRRASSASRPRERRGPAGERRQPRTRATCSRPAGACRDPRRAGGADRARATTCWACSTSETRAGLRPMRTPTSLQIVADHLAVAIQQRAPLRAGRTPGGARGAPAPSRASCTTRSRR